MQPRKPQKEELVKTQSFEPIAAESIDYQVAPEDAFGSMSSEAPDIEDIDLSNFVVQA